MVVSGYIEVATLRLAPEVRPAGRERVERAILDWQCCGYRRGALCAKFEGVGYALRVGYRREANRKVRVVAEICRSQGCRINLASAQPVAFQEPHKSGRAE